MAKIIDIRDICIEDEDIFDYFEEDIVIGKIDFINRKDVIKLVSK
jgi:hypothetical protein